MRSCNRTVNFYEYIEVSNSPQTIIEFMKDNLFHTINNHKLKTNLFSILKNQVTTYLKNSQKASLVKNAVVIGDNIYVTTHFHARNWCH